MTKRRKTRWYIVPQNKAETLGRAGFATKVDAKGRYWVLCEAKDLMNLTITA